jgi:O-acetylserine/cysteine efflux transporter
VSLRRARFPGKVPRNRWGDVVIMPIRDIALAVLVPVLWGPCYASAKPVLEIFPPLMLVAMVYTIVALLFTPLVPRCKTPWKTLFLLGFFGGSLQTSMVFLSLTYLPASTAALVMQAQLPVGVVASWFMGRDKPNLKNTLGCIICLVGVAIVVGMPEATDAWLGLIAMLVGVASWAIAQAVIPVVAKDRGMTLYAGMTRFAAPQMILLSLVFEHDQLATLATIPGTAWAAVPALAMLGFALPYWIWYSLLMRHRVDELMPFVLLMPIFSVAVAVTMLGEPLPPTLLLGGAIVIAGLALIVFKLRSVRAAGETRGN